MDANLTLGLFLSLPYSSYAERVFYNWWESRKELYVPLLWEYECVSGLRRAVVVGQLTPAEAQEILLDILKLKPQTVAPTSELHQLALVWAERLRQNKAYDAHYVALAENLGAELWSADRRLVDNLNSLGVVWAHWVGEEAPGES